MTSTAGAERRTIADGARLYLMRLGLYGNGSPVAGYLIQTGDSNILVDTGYPREVIGMAEEYGGAEISITNEQFVVNQLLRVGVAPGDVRYIIVTHLDPDHSGALDEFPNAELMIQCRQWEARDSPRYQHTRAHWAAQGLNYRLVEGDCELVPGVQLLETSGHAPGHQSVLIRLPQTGPVILAIDAIPYSLCLDPDTRPITAFDDEEGGVRASTRKLVELAQHEGAKLLVLGHDGSQWSGLKTLPEYYG